MPVHETGTGPPGRRVQCPAPPPRAVTTHRPRAPRAHEPSLRHPPDDSSRPLGRAERRAPPPHADQRSHWRPGADPRDRHRASRPSRPERRPASGHNTPSAGAEGARTVGSTPAGRQFTTTRQSRAARPAAPRPTHPAWRPGAGPRDRHRASWPSRPLPHPAPRAVTTHRPRAPRAQEPSLRHPPDDSSRPLGGGERRVPPPHARNARPEARCRFTKPAPGLQVVTSSAPPRERSRHTVRGRRGRTNRRFDTLRTTVRDHSAEASGASRRPTAPRAGGTPAGAHARAPRATEPWGGALGVGQRSGTSRSGAPT